MLKNHLTIGLALALTTAACGDDEGGSGGVETDTNVTTSPQTTNPTTDPSGSTSGDESSTTDPTDPSATNPTATNPTATGPDTDSESASESDTESSGDATYFRLNTVAVRDPHFFAPVLGDVTIANVNDPLTAALSEDLLPEGAPDGFLDLGFVLKLEPLDQVDGAMENFSYYNAQCTAPVDSTTCDILPTTPEYPTTYTSMAGECYAPNAANLSSYPDQPGPPEPTPGPCFVTDASSVSIQTASFTLPIDNATVSAQYVGDPAGNLVAGNIEGFISAANAAVTMVDTGSILGVVALDTLLEEADMDGDGWIFHIAFTAVPVEWTGA